MIAKIINPKNFKPFGRIIEFPSVKANKESENLFRIVLKETQNVGWRIAYLVVRQKHIRRLEQHPKTFESFEPIKGKTFLYLAKNKDSKKIECFYLDRPVILNKGIWHGIVTATKESEVKITENAKVKSVYWPLDFSLNSKHKLVR